MDNRLVKVSQDDSTEDVFDFPHDLDKIILRDLKRGFARLFELRPEESELLSRLAGSIPQKTRRRAIFLKAQRASRQFIIKECKIKERDYRALFRHDEVNAIVSALRQRFNEYMMEMIPIANPVKRLVLLEVNRRKCAALNDIDGERKAIELAHKMTEGTHIKIERDHNLNIVHHVAKLATKIESANKDLPRIPGRIVGREVGNV